MAVPTLNRRGSARTTSNATSWTPAPSANVNNAIPAGQKTLWVYLLASDGIPTISLDGSSDAFTKVTQFNETTGEITLAIFTLVTTSAFAASARPAFGITSSASEQFNLFYFAVTADSGLDSKAIIGLDDGDSTNSNPPSVTNDSGSTIDALVMIFRCGDSTTAVTAYPGGYGSLSGLIAANTNGVTLQPAQKTVNLSSWDNGSNFDPPSFSSATEQWIAGTIMFYQLAPPDAVYIGEGNRASVYVGAQSDPYPYVGAKVLFP